MNTNLLDRIDLLKSLARSDRLWRCPRARRCRAVRCASNADPPIRSCGLYPHEHFSAAQCRRCRSRRRANVTRSRAWLSKSLPLPLLLPPFASHETHALSAKMVRPALTAAEHEPTLTLASPFPHFVPLASTFSLAFVHTVRRNSPCRLNSTFRTRRAPQPASRTLPFRRTDLLARLAPLPSLDRTAHSPTTP